MLPIECNKDKQKYKVEKKNVRNIITKSENNLDYWYKCICQISIQLFQFLSLSLASYSHKERHYYIKYLILYFWWPCDYTRDFSLILSRSCQSIISILLQVNPLALTFQYDFYWYYIFRDILFIFIIDFKMLIYLECEYPYFK